MTSRHTVSSVYQLALWLGVAGLTNGRQACFSFRCLPSARSHEEADFDQEGTLSLLYVTVKHPEKS